MKQNELTLQSLSGFIVLIIPGCHSFGFTGNYLRKKNVFLLLLHTDTHMDACCLLHSYCKLHAPNATFRPQLRTGNGICHLNTHPCPLFNLLRNTETLETQHIENASLCTFLGYFPMEIFIKIDKSVFYRRQYDIVSM